MEVECWLLELLHAAVACGGTNVGEGVVGRESVEGLVLTCPRRSAQVVDM